MEARMTRTRATSVAVWAALLALLFLPGCESDQGPGEPGLVVLVVVDQFSAHLLDRYEPLLGHGLHRLLEEGHRFGNAEHDHAVTSSSQGHATVATGRVPAHHGIVDNSWYIPAEGRIVSSVADTQAAIPGRPELPGVSPRHRFVAGIGDWVLAMSPEARAVVIAQGTGSGMGLAPLDPRGQVYWSSPAALGFVTSDYYRDDYPGWVAAFNDAVWPRVEADSVWESTIPATADAPRDAMGHEGDGIHTTFPHRRREELGDPTDSAAVYAWVRGRPMHDELILSLVRAAVQGERLGRRGVTDYLGVNLSSLDDVGHDYGAWSLEQLDALLRLDRELGDLLEFLDAELGPRGYVLAITGDHGVAPAPEVAARLDLEGRRVTQADADRLFAAIREIGPPPETYDPELAVRVAEAAEEFDFVADAMTREDLESPSPDVFVARYQNSYRPDRIPWFPLRASDGTTLAAYGVMARLTEGAIPDYAVAVHGSPYAYDRQVPLVFFGGGVMAGRADRPVRTVDVAPTLAALASIPVPENLDGQALGGVRRPAD
jgi:predicted AlkP superfamily pyrophosphatase or phosphodiesterase